MTKDKVLVCSIRDRSKDDSDFFREDSNHRRLHLAEDLENSLVLCLSGMDFFLHRLLYLSYVEWLTVIL